MRRRDFVRRTGLAAAGLPWVGLSSARAADHPGPGRGDPRSPDFALDGHRVRYYLAGIASPLRIVVIADTHLFRDDARGEPYRQYSGRMARAYNETRHFETGEVTNPEAGFVEALRLAREDRADLVVLAGDVFSFPSEAAIEWVQERMAECGLPYLYVAGNHDWHYEGMPGTLAELRSTWIRNRLSVMYQGADPLMAVREVGGIRVVVLDDSTYEILPEQLEFFRAQVRTEQPLVLCVHIPLYAPGRGIGFGCGHPEWGATSDRNHELERRPKWPEAGHTAVTMAFHREVFATPNLLGIFAGHIHRSSLDLVHGRPQFVADANATGAYLSVEFLPEPVPPM